MRTIVAGDHPTILAILAMGTPASSIRLTAVCFGSNHRGGDEKMSTSPFRRSVNKIHGIAAGRPLRDWVRNNCTFAFVAIPDPDRCSAVEALTVRLLRRQACKLLNA